jgi:hypothetical protein
MKDIISINRQFLIIARERANAKRINASNDVVTGLSAKLLSRIGQLSIEEIEGLAQSEISLITIRIDESQIDKIITEMREKKRTAYLLASLP